MPTESNTRARSKPAKPRPDFPLFAHATGRWAKKISGKIEYFGPWDDPAGAEQRWEDFKAGKPQVRKTRRRIDKPRKPYPDFPLFAHSSGRWAKKIRGQLAYFGKWADGWEAALAKYKEVADDLHAGLTPRSKSAGLQLRDLINQFLSTKLHLVETGELRQGTFNEYHRTCGLVLDCLGKDRLVTDIRANNFQQVREHLGKGMGLGELGKRIGIVRSVFKWGTENELITHAVVFGSGFKKPTQKALRIERAAAPSRMLTASELQAIIDTAGVPLKAMVLLALNSGFGNSDIAELPIAAIADGWVRFPAPKTGVPRKCPLWPETIKAVDAAKAGRIEPKEKADAHRLFITSFGAAWVRHQPSRKSEGKWTWVDGVNLEFGKLIAELGIKRPGVSFYSLRHVVRTIADKANDRPATDAIMGHAPEAEDMGPRYVDSIGDDRYQKVTDCVRSWVFAKGGKKSKTV